MTDFLIGLFMAFVATLAFSALFNVPRAEAVFCGLTGTICWLVYSAVLLIMPGSIVLATFAATLCLTAFSRFLSYTRRAPASVYLATGVIPIVPGAGIYYTMYALTISNDNAMAVAKGIETLKLAGVIAAGIMIILSLPKEAFDWAYRKAH